MGALFFFDETVPNGGKPGVCQVQVLDQHGVPEVRIGPAGSAHQGFMAYFPDWAQFLRFVESVNDVKDRLHRLHE